MLRYYVESQPDGTFLGTCPDFPYLQPVEDSFPMALEAIQDLVERAMDEATPSESWYE